MEPGHPPRQDPPTEPSHDQVNGSPPRPRSRRGWMSDSPLDGGSGWPTSAYAIVPRQATPQTQQVPAQPSADTTAQQPAVVVHDGDDLAARRAIDVAVDLAAAALAAVAALTVDRAEALVLVVADVGRVAVAHDDAARRAGLGAPLDVVLAAIAADREQCPRP